MTQRHLRGTHPSIASELAVVEGAVHEQTVVVSTGDVRLEGTLSMPGTPGPHPAALLLSGSGPLDRDSNMARQRLDVAQALASGLASCGVASLRFDKRGVGMSGGSI